MSNRFFFKFPTKKAGSKGPDTYHGDVIWDESDGPTHLKFWTGNEYQRLSDMVRNEIDKKLSETQEALRYIAVADWKTSGELRCIARRALEAAK